MPHPRPARERPHHELRKRVGHVQTARPAALRFQGLRRFACYRGRACVTRSAFLRIPRGLATGWPAAEGLRRSVGSNAGANAARRDRQTRPRPACSWATDWWLPPTGLPLRQVLRREERLLRRQRKCSVGCPPGTICNEGLESLSGPEPEPPSQRLTAAGRQDQQSARHALASRLVGSLGGVPTRECGSVRVNVPYRGVRSSMGTASTPSRRVCGAAGRRLKLPRRARTRKARVKRETCPRVRRARSSVRARARLRGGRPRGPPL